MARLSLTAMRAFIEVMHTGSTIAAARALGTSQSGISRLLAQMEAEIGFELFYRDRGRLVPTKDGLAVADEVDLALAGVERVQGLVRDIAAHAVGEIRMIAPASFAEGVLPGLVATFMARFPGVRVSIDSRSIPTTKTMLATRVVDCAFMRMPVDRDDLIAETMLTSGTTCVLHRNHPLAGHETLDPPTIGRMPIVSLGTASVVGRRLDEAFRSFNQRQNIVVECHTVNAACAMARNGIGIAIVNEMLARPYLSPSVVARPFVPEILNHYAFVVSGQTKLSPLVHEFREEARRYLGALARP